MIALAILTAATLLSGPPQRIIVRSGAKATPVEVERLSDGPAIRADLLAAALGGKLQRNDNHFVVAFQSVRLQFIEGVPTVKTDSETLPMTAAPHLVKERVYVPLQVVSDIIPRVVQHLFYDTALGELRSLNVASKKTTGSDPIARGADEEAGDDEAVKDRPKSARPRVEANSRETSAPTRAPRRLGKGRTKFLVVVDAGHGGPDNGMSGPIGSANKIYEKDITLAVAKKLAAELKGAGVEVLMTRTRDTLIALHDRGKIANKAGADLFVSVHVNAANMGWQNPAAARGFETYFLSEAKTEDARRVEQMENDAVRYEGEAADDNDGLNFILKDMVQNESFRESSVLAKYVQDELGRIHPGPDRGVKQANFAVLRTSFVPAGSVLIEIGFGTNRAEAAYISSAARQQELASAIARSLIAHLEGYQQRSGKAH
jgi:N-acetylmuramoyl-L-alanine amidase